MRKRISLLALIIICLSAFSISITAITDEETYAGNQLRVLGILQGYPDGTLKLENKISRAEVATLTVRILGYENAIILGKEKEFTDLTNDHWAYGNVQNAYKLGVINGYPQGDFRPSNNITYAEVVAIMVNALGESDSVEGEWPNNYLNKGKELGIIPENSTVPQDKIVTRGEMAVIIWDTLLVKK